MVFEGKKSSKTFDSTSSNLKACLREKKHEKKKKIPLGLEGLKTCLNGQKSSKTFNSTPLGLESMSQREKKRQKRII